MTTELFIKICVSVVSIACALITAYLVPYIKGHISQADFERVSKWVEVAVMCADQIYNTEEFQKKKIYVFTYIKDLLKRINIEMSNDDIDVLIESIVNELHHGGKNEVK